jgi:hypothetical protein
MEEEFYAVIKLISGEEIFSKVCPCEEEERILLILDNPVTIETVNLKQFGLTGVKVNPWIKFTDDTMFIINMDKVLTMSEVNDEDLLKMYNKYVRNKNKETKVNKPTANMGYLSSITDARIYLEKLYKLEN